MHNYSLNTPQMYSIVAMPQCTGLAQKWVLLRVNLCRQLSQNLWIDTHSHSCGHVFTMVVNQTIVFVSVASQLAYAKKK